MKTALLLCASHNDFGTILALRKLGYRIIVTGSIPNQMGERLCDEYIQADYSDKDLILSIAKEKKIDAVVQCANDFGVYTAAYVAEQLHLSGYDSYQTTLTLHEKHRFKQFVKKNNIPSFEFQVFTNKAAAVDYLASAIFPIIIKPTDTSAGNGTHRADNIAQGVQYIAEAFKHSRSHTIVIEQFVTGRQFCLCTFLHNKKVVAYSSANEYSIINPYRVEMVTHPSDIPFDITEKIIVEIEKIASILNLKDGVFHVQYIYDGKRFYILEVMRRLLGNRHFINSNLLTNMDWEYWETKAKCGLDCSGISFNGESGYYACKTILAQQNGQIEAINGLSIYDKYVFNTITLKTIGDVIDNYPSQVIQILYMIFPTKEEMHKVLVEQYRNDFVVTSSIE